MLKDKLFTLNTKIKRGLKESKEKQEKNKTDVSNTFKADLLNTIGQAVMAADLNGIISFWNKAAEETYGWTAEEAIGNNVLDLIPSQQTKEQATEIMNALYQGNSWSGELVMQRKDGNTFTAWITDSPVYDAQHNLVGIIGISSDLTERKKIEQKLEKANRLYSFISHINKTITHVREEMSLFRDACTIACDHGKFQIAWIGKIDRENKKINLAEQCGISEENLSLFENVPYEKGGPQDYVLSTGNAYISNNIENDLKLINWKKFASAQQIRSCMVLPLKKAGVITDTFNLYSSELNFFDDAEIKMLEEVAADISFGLDLIEKEKIQKETEARLVQSEKLFRALIENSTDMKTLTSKEGRVVYPSPSIKKGLGYTTEEFLHKYPQDLIHPDELQQYLEKRKELIKNPGKSFPFIQRRHHKNGEWIWCEGTITNMLEDPAIQAMVSNFNDISKQKKAENLREFDSNNLDALINNTADLMWSVDRDFKLITSNQPFDEMGKVNFGKSIVKGESVLLAAYTPEMLAHFKELYERAFAGEQFIETEHFDFPVEFWTEISYYPIREGNEVIGTACHSRDISELKRKENQLRKSEAFNRGVLNSLNSHIAIIDKSGNIVAVNESWKTFAKENGDTKLQRTAEGTNYFSVCDKAAEAGDEIAVEVLLGMKAIMTEKDKYFYLEYPCHSPNKQRWFGMRAMKFMSDVPMIVVAHMDISERKLAEEKLLQSEAKLKEAQSIAHISNWDIDLLTNTHTWSDEFYNLYGINKGEVKPSAAAFLSFIHPEDVVCAQQKMEEAFITLKSSSMNFRFISKDGSIKYGYTEWRFGFDNIHNPIRLYGILQDVSEQKRAEIILKESESRLAEAQAIAHFSNWEIDMVNNIITWSDELYKIFGVNKEEVKPSTELFFSFIHPEDVEQVKENVRETLEDLKGSSSDFRFYRNNGTLGYAHMERKLELDKENKPIRLYGILQDTTEQKKAELIIIESESRLAEAQALAKIGSWETDLLTMNVIWSAETFRIFELNPDNFKASHPAFLEYVHPDDRQKVEDAFTGSYDKELINLMEHRIVTSTGVIKMVEERWQIFRDSKGVPAWAVGTCQDITERKNAEQKLEQQNQELVKTNNELDHFVYSTSHDLRAPLTSIMGLIDLLETESLNENATDLLKLMKNCLIKSDDTIKEIIDYSRNSRFEIRKEKIDSEKLIEDIFESIALFDLSKQINKKLSVTKSADFYSDKLRLKIILSNIMFNAVKYSKSDTNLADLQIDVDISQERAFIIIKDNGIGIEAGLISRVFEMFYRASESSTGSGLGLYITKECVEKLNGTIELQSEFGVGTVIKLNIPNLLTK